MNLGLIMQKIDLKHLFIGNSHDNYCNFKNKKLA